MKLSAQVFCALASILLAQDVVSSRISLTEDSLKAAIQYEIAKVMLPGLPSEDIDGSQAGFVLTEVVRSFTLDSEISSRASLTCILCNSVSNVVINYWREGMEESKILNTIANLCVTLNLQTEDVCSGLIKLNAPIIFYILENKNDTSASSVCGVVLQAQGCSLTNEEFEWTVEVDDGTPQYISSEETDETIKIVQITDPHYDPAYEVFGNSQCAEPTCCRKGQNDTNTSGTVAGFWGDFNDCDSPWHAIDDAIDQVANTEEDISYVYFTGDIIDHGVWETTRDGNIESIRKTFAKLYKTFGSIPVYSILGNHEPNPTNVFAPASVTDEELSTAWLYELIADMWIGYGWLPESTRSTILQGGFYTVSPKAGFRIIALNNNVCYVFNWWLLYEPQDPDGQLKWLAETLFEAEKAGEYVHILSHMPPGTGSCQFTWGREYRKIVNRFAHIITAEFNGHTHNDEIRVIYDLKEPTKAIRVAWNGGGVTTYSNVNPNYKVYTVNANTYFVEEVDTWIYNLTLANKTPEDNPVWYKSYSFKEEYGLQDLSISSLNELVHRMARDSSILATYHGHYVKQADPSLAWGCDEGCRANQLCKIVTAVADDQTQCNYFSNLS